MTGIDLHVVTANELDDLLGPVAGLFREDAGTHDSIRTPGHVAGKLIPASDLRHASFAVLESIRVDAATRGGGVEL